MKHSKGFIICASASIFLLLFIPIFIIILKQENGMIFYLLSAVFSFIFTIIFGVKNIIKSSQLFKEKMNEDLYRMWWSLKLLNIPVFILNFIFCLVIAFMGFVLFPLNLVIIITTAAYVLMCVILTGFVGFFAIKSKKEAGRKINSACCVMQFIPFWDVVSTLIIKGKELL